MDEHAPHPGRILFDEVMTPLGVSRNQLARDIDVPVGRISAIVSGTRAITADTALRLARYFGTAPELWMRLQADYELARAREQAGAEIEARVRVRRTRAPLAATAPAPAQAPEVAPEAPLAPEVPPPAPEAPVPEAAPRVGPATGTGFEEVTPSRKGPAPRAAPGGFFSFDEEDREDEVLELSPDMIVEEPRMAPAPRRGSGEEADEPVPPIPDPPRAH